MVVMLNQLLRLAAGIRYCFINLTVGKSSTVVNAQALNGCDDHCGNVSIPYPFGTRKGCYMNESFLITCSPNYTPPLAFLGKGNLRVTYIWLQGELRVNAFVAHDCYNQNGSRANHNEPSMNLYGFSISNNRNKFTAIGCDTSAVIEGNLGTTYATGCISLCNSKDDVITGSCSGIGCCQTAIPKGGNQTCSEAKKDLKSYACTSKDNRTVCHDSENGPGYWCSCSKGFIGNPYIPDGCKGYEGDGKRSGKGCTPIRAMPESKRFPLMNRIVLGCCLETQVPMLVYEFVTNGTVFEHIHNIDHSSTLQWQLRLQIAVETAGALSYLHFAASTPIIHRDIKSTNLTTLVQGTLGYLDPEYLQSSQLTEKSDVYSFGVLLAELLTGKKALSFDRPEEERNLAMHFVLSMKENRLFEILDPRVVNEGNAEQLMEVAMLVKRCLRLKGEERPTMKEVAIELEGLKAILEKPPCVKGNMGLEETKHSLSKLDDACLSGANSDSTCYDSIKSQVNVSVLDDGR
uniref:Protein kinase domain-containing protein n=1 Tax=Fagus sylvatica TaxID=28930 RepID=A0A2N9IK48_FAGSY